MAIDLSTLQGMRDAAKTEVEREAWDCVIGAHLGMPMTSYINGLMVAAVNEQRLYHNDSGQKLDRDAKHRVIHFKRHGDFYEATGDEAIWVADALGLVWTKGKITGSPCVGIPAHRFEEDRRTLLAMWFSVSSKE